MAYVIINEKHLTAIADALRAKGTTELYKPREMAEAIKAFNVGGYNGLLGKYFNGVDVPGAAFEIMIKDCINDDGTLFIPEDMWTGKTISGPVVIPFGITEVPANTFKDVEGITGITFPYGLTTIGDYAFDNAINGPDTIIIPGPDVTRIGQYAFANNTFKKFITNEGDNTLIIAPYAFQNTSFEELELNGKVTVGQYAFEHSSFSNRTAALKTITINGDVTFNKYAFRHNTVLTTVNGVLTNIPEGLFYKCNELEHITLGDNLTSIAPYAFYWCHFTEIVIPANVTTIGAHAFEACCHTITSSNPYPSLTVTLPEGLKTIGESAFSDNFCLYEITLPETLQTIGVGAFSNTGLYEITIPASVKDIPQDAFKNCNLEKIKLNEGLETIGDGAFANTGRVRYSVSCPSTLRSIGANAFADSTLSSISLKEGLETIGSGAFKNTPLVGLGCPASLQSFSSDIVSNSNSELSILEFNLSPNHQLSFTGSYLAMTSPGYGTNRIIFKGQNGQIPKSASNYLFSHSNVNNANTVISVPWSQSENPAGFPWGATRAQIVYNNGL